MTIADYLNKLKQDQASLIQAVNVKGGTLKTSATLNEIKTGIDTLPQSGGGVETLTQAEYDALATKEEGKVYLIVAEVVVERETRIESVPFTTITTENSAMDQGSEVVTAQGVDGERTIIEDVTYTDGVETNRVVISSTITKEPAPKRVTVGTKTVAQVNLLSPSNVSVRWGAETVGSDLTTRILGFDEKLTQLDSNIFKVGEHGGGFTISGVATTQDQKISVIFDYEVMAGTFKTAGGYAEGAYEKNSVYVDGVKAEGMFWTSEPGPAVEKGVGGNGTIKVDIDARENGGAHMFTFQPNKGTGVYPVTIKVSNLRMVNQ